MPFTPFDPESTVYDHNKGRLPHWRQRGVTYFVTARLADALPSAVRDAWHQRRTAWLAANAPGGFQSLSEEQKQTYHREFTTEFHRLLDAGHGDCLLTRPECAEILVHRFLCGHGRAYSLDAWVVMPNHFHALVEPAPGSTLGDILKSWKGGSAHEINRALNRTGPLWQAEVFDHIVRSRAHLDHFRRYIAQNPAKAKLRSGFTMGLGKERAWQGNSDPAD